MLEPRSPVAGMQESEVVGPATRSCPVESTLNSAGLLVQQSTRIKGLRLCHTDLGQTVHVRTPREKRCLVSWLEQCQSLDPYGYSEVSLVWAISLVTRARVSVGHFGHKGESAAPQSGPVWRLSWELFGYTRWATIPRTGGHQPQNWTGTLFFEPASACSLWLRACIF